MFEKERKQEKLDAHQIVASLLSFIINDEALSVPVYLEEIKSEQDADALGLTPAVYVWNENRDTGSFTVSVNGKTIGHLLEGVVPREHSQFNAIRDEVMVALSISSKATIVSICERLGAFPSDIFGAYENAAERARLPARDGRR